MPTRRHRITVSYDGTSYGGWQIQPNTPTIQEEIEKAIKTITGETVRVHGSGRTDAGVHARGQVAHFDLAKALPLTSLARGLNALLPDAIRVVNARHVQPDFHARHSAVRKEYRYFIWNAPVVPPFLRLYRTQVRGRLDETRMRAAAASLVGEHDFAAFTANPTRPVAGTVRTLTRLHVKRRGSEWVIIASGTGFLYKMVRSLAGLLIRVGQGDLGGEEVAAILDSKVRTAEVPTAPARGLTLWRVWY